MLIPLLLAGGAAYFLLRKTDPTGSGPRVKVTGKSGTVWTAQRVKVIKGLAFYDIFLKGRRVARYKQPLKGTKRFYIGSPPGTSQAVLMKVIADFNLVAPSILKKIKPRTPSLPKPKRRVRRRK